jgi:hypothetical protein
MRGSCLSPPAWAESPASVTPRADAGSAPAVSTQSPAPGISRSRCRSTPGRPADGWCRCRSSDALGHAVAGAVRGSRCWLPTRPLVSDDSSRERHRGGCRRQAFGCWSAPGDVVAVDGRVEEPATPGESVSPAGRRSGRINRVAESPAGWSTRVPRWGCGRPPRRTRAPVPALCGGGGPGLPAAHQIRQGPARLKEF